MPSDSSLGFNQLVATPNGPFLVNRNDQYVGRSWIEYGEFSEEEGKFLDDLISPGDIVLEVGANMGSHTVRMARKVEHGRVIAFEPQRLIFQLLCANVALASLKNVECHWAALGAKRGGIEVPELDPDEPNNFGALSLNLGEAGQKVPCYTADEIFVLPRLDLIKIDVEGMEAEVIIGASRLIKEHQPLLYVENDRIDHSENLMRIIDSMGYAMYWHTPPLFSLDNPAHKEEDIFGSIASCNMFCAPKHMQQHIDIPKIENFTENPLKPCQVQAA